MVLPLHGNWNSKRTARLFVQLLILILEMLIKIKGSFGLGSRLDLAIASQGRIR